MVRPYVIVVIVTTHGRGRRPHRHRNSDVRGECTKNRFALLRQFVNPCAASVYYYHSCSNAAARMLITAEPVLFTSPRVHQSSCGGYTRAPIRYYRGNGTCRARFMPACFIIIFLFIFFIPIAAPTKPFNLAGRDPRSTIVRRAISQLQ